jgi:hypothetical protein
LRQRSVLGICGFGQLVDVTEVLPVADDDLGVNTGMANRLERLQLGAAPGEIQSEAAAITDELYLVSCARRAGIA